MIKTKIILVVGLLIGFCVNVNSQERELEFWERNVAIFPSGIIVGDDRMFDFWECVEYSLEQTAIDKLRYMIKHTKQKNLRWYLCLDNLPDGLECPEIHLQNAEVIAYFSNDKPRQMKLDLRKGYISIVYLDLFVTDEHLTVKVRQSAVRRVIFNKLRGGWSGSSHSKYSYCHDTKKWKLVQLTFAEF